MTGVASPPLLLRHGLADGRTLRTTRPLHCVDDVVLSLVGWARGGRQTPTQLFVVRPALNEAKTNQACEALGQHAHASNLAAKARLYLQTHRRFESWSGAPWCPRVSLNAQECPSMSKDVSECPRMSKSVPECPRMSQKISECPRVSQNGPEYPRRSQEIPEYL